MALNLFTNSTLNYDVSCLGFPPQKPAVTGYLAATQAVVAAMKEMCVTRLVLCHSW